MEGEWSGALGSGKGEVFYIKHQESLNHSLFFYRISSEKEMQVYFRGSMYE